MVSTRARAKFEQKQDVAMVHAFVLSSSIAQAVSNDSPKTDVSMRQKSSKSTINGHFGQSKVISLKYKIIATSSTKKTGSRALKSTPVSAVSTDQQNPNAIVKKTIPRARRAPVSTELKLVLRVKYSDIEPANLTKMGIRRKRTPRGYYPYPPKSFKLGHNPWEHLYLRKPNKEEVRDIHHLLSEYHKQFDFGTFVSQPAHAVRGIVTVDAVIQTILAQSTSNEMAIDAHSRLCNRFTYLVDGKKHVGNIPNWHAARKAPRSELEKILKPGGYQVIRSKAMQTLLDMVYAENSQRKAAGTQQYYHDASPPDAKDFVPGMLSLEYLTDYPESSDENSDEKLLGRLVKLPLIGIKSAMCIMAFQLKRPVFVVDTHVLRYMKWLGWVPKHANEDQVAQYLHKVIPDDVKYDLHNQIWTHCANENVREGRGREVICPYCGSNPPAKGKNLSKYKCPLEDFLPPLSKRWNRAYVEVQSKDDEMDLDPPVPPQPAEKAAESITTTSTNITEVVETTEKKNGVQTKKRTTVQKQQTTIESAFGIISKTDSTSSESDSSQPSKTKAVPEKKFKRRDTMLFDEMTSEQAAELGYLLWEFRPMDNSFMEEWGTFDKMPRYKWEKPDIMDPDVAVTPEYARGVLEGKIQHRWSKKETKTKIIKEVTEGSI